MRKSRISSWKQRKLLEHSVAGTPARMVAGLVRDNKTTVAYYYHRLREGIYQAVADATPFAGEIEVDESYFWGTPQRQARAGCGGEDSGVWPVKTGRKALCGRHCQAKAATLLPVLKERIEPDSIVYSDSLPSYNALDVAGFWHTLCHR